MGEELNHYYSKKEERLNIITHAFGLLLSFIALTFLIIKSLNYQGFWKPASLIIYGLSLIILYAASTLYHLATETSKRRILNIFDHSAIYILIAGTYTPFTIIALEGVLGWIIFAVTWIFAFVGIVLKLFFTGRFDKLSTAMYLLMGWQILFVIDAFIQNINPKGLYFLLAGGVFYTLGAVFYSIKKINYNHAIFHVFVVLGSFCHFFTVFYYM
ncbi:MAG: hemolysin III family protein [Flavobacteriaceae bacterium]|nr:hemolysin III family protein [Flavobacteriaceae bacterium]